MKSFFYLVWFYLIAFIILEKITLFIFIILIHLISIFLRYWTVIFFILIEIRFGIVILRLFVTLTKLWSFILILIFLLTKKTFLLPAFSLSSPWLILFARIRIHNSLELTVDLIIHFRLGVSTPALLIHITNFTRSWILRKLRFHQFISQSQTCSSYWLSIHYFVKLFWMYCHHHLLI